MITKSKIINTLKDISVTVNNGSDLGRIQGIDYEDTGVFMYIGTIVNTEGVNLDKLNEKNLICIEKLGIHQNNSYVSIFRNRTRLLSLEYDGTIDITKVPTIKYFNHNPIISTSLTKKDVSLMNKVIDSLGIKDFWFEYAPKDNYYSLVQLVPKAR